MVVYFSGTGNSKYVAERIAGSLQEKLLCMNEQIKSGDTGTVKTGENLVVVVPTYAWRIPRVVSDWIGQTEFVGAKNVWYVMSCGSGIGGADIYNRKLSEKKGLKHMGTAQIIMPENFGRHGADIVTVGCNAAQDADQRVDCKLSIIDDQYLHSYTPASLPYMFPVSV